MNRTQLSSPLLFALLSAAVGSIFPLTAYYLIISGSGISFSPAGLIRIHREVPLLWMVDMAPLVLGGYGFGLGVLFGRLRQRSREHANGYRKLRAILDNVADGIAVIDKSGTIRIFNKSACAMFGYHEIEILGQSADLLMPADQRLSHADLIERYLCGGQPRVIGKRREVQAERKGGERMPVELRVSDLNLDGEPLFIGAFTDISEKKQLEAQLLQARTLESIGQLASGVAHEINTPIQFVGDNLRALEQYFSDLEAVIRAYREIKPELAEASRQRIESMEGSSDLDFILQDSPEAIRQAINGTERVAHIVRAMKDYAHADRSRAVPTDINRLLANTLVVARNEYKYVADVETDYGDLPMVECHASELGQCFLNLLINAAHAIEDKGPERGIIAITTRAAGDQVEIAVADSGSGIPIEIRNRIFDPFFTTKAIGKGTGQGLHIVHQVVVQKHRGRIDVDSEPSKGTRFVLTIPVHMAGGEGKE
jgi:PAS domain S-box-containing protein